MLNEFESREGALNRNFMKPITIQTTKKVNHCPYVKGKKFRKFETLYRPIEIKN
jgi:hypothetical protein